MTAFAYFTPDKHFLLVKFEVVNNEPVIKSIAWQGMNVLPLLNQGYCQLLDNIEERAYELMSAKAIQ